MTSSTDTRRLYIQHTRLNSTLQYIMPLSRKMTIFAIVCFVSGVANAKVITTLEKFLDFPDEQIFLSSENLNGNSKQLEGLPYATCRSSPLQSAVKCKIVIQSQVTNEKTCEVVFEATSSNNSIISAQMKLFPFGSEKVLLVYIDRPRRTICNQKLPPGFIKGIIVDMKSLPCQCKNMILKEVPDNQPIWHILQSSSFLYNNNSNIFNLVFRNGTQQWFKFTLYDDGTVRNTTEPWILSDSRYKVLEFISVEPNSTSKGYLQFDIDRHHQYAQVVLLNSFGIPLKRLIGSTNSTLRAISLVNQTITIAVVVNSKDVIVRRFDQKGNSKRIIVLNYEAPVVNLAIHNLADGGFLILTVAEKEKYRVTKVNAYGRSIGQLEIKGLRLSCASNEDYTEIVKVDENENENELMYYCVSFVCSRKQILGPFHEDTHMNQLVKCFLDEDFIPL